jgi:hypothetical protein
MRRRCRGVRLLRLGITLKPVRDSECGSDLRFQSAVTFVYGDLADKLAQDAAVNSDRYVITPL